MGQTSYCLIHFYLRKYSVTKEKKTAWPKIQNIWLLHHGSQLISRDYSLSKHWDTVSFSVWYVLFAIWTESPITVALVLSMDDLSHKNRWLLLNWLWLCFPLRDNGNTFAGANDGLTEGGSQCQRMIKNLNLPCALRSKQSMCLSTWSNRLMSSLFLNN